MSVKSTPVHSWIIGIAAVAAVSISLASSAYFSKQASNAQEVGVVLNSEIAELRAALAQSPSKGKTKPVATLNCPDSTGSNAAIQDLRDEIGLLANSLAEVQFGVHDAFANQNHPGRRVALAPDFEPLPIVAPPRMGANPEKMMQWRDEASQELREHVDTVIRDHAERARQKIEVMSSDPARPDFEVVARVMQESDTEIAAELREVLPQEHFEALFPPETEAGAPLAQADYPY